jgi:hypothetical protein
MDLRRDEIGVELVVKEFEGPLVLLGGFVSSEKAV